jgi:hypothetical protein
MECLLADNWGMNDAPDRAGSITYADGTTAVLPGDRVSLRFFLRRRPGEVIYVPGISKHRGTYEHHGLTWVGVSLPDGWAVGTIVLPENHRLQRGVRFLGRGAESVDAARALERVDRLEEEEDAEDAKAKALESQPIAKPGPMDWVAGVLAVALHLGAYLLVMGALGAAVWWLRRVW